jgi:hypothetical protein
MHDEGTLPAMHWRWPALDDATQRRDAEEFQSTALLPAVSRPDAESAAGGAAMPLRAPSNCRNIK